MRSTDISCINEDDLEVYTDYKQINEQKMIPLHYVTDLNRGNNQKVFLEISRYFCKSHCFCWLSRFLTFRGWQVCLLHPLFCCLRQLWPSRATVMQRRGRGPVSFRGSSLERSYSTGIDILQQLSLNFNSQS